MKRLPATSFEEHGEQAALRVLSSLARLFEQEQIVSVSPIHSSVAVDGSTLLFGGPATIQHHGGPRHER